MNRSQCAFCGQQVYLVHVHGHYQCPVCKTNALPCCDGDNCDTNILLKNNEEPDHRSKKSNTRLINPHSSSRSNDH